LQIVARPNLDRMGLNNQVFGMVQAEVSAIPRAIEVLRASPATILADRVSGEYDIVFLGAFPSQRALGDLLHELQFDGIRRVVVHHQLERVIDTEGWEAALEAPGGSAPQGLTIQSAGAVVPAHLRAAFDLATAWWEALANGELDALRNLSSPDIVYTVRRPQQYAGVMNGIEEVIEHSRAMRRTAVRLRREVVRVAESDIPGYTLTLDALGTVEDLRGRAKDMFGRLAFALGGGVVTAAVSLAELDLPTQDERTD
jgi:ketosteroid isomerase-like protein